jgi:hypothetical protein
MKKGHIECGSFFRLISKRLMLLRYVTLKTEVDYNGRCETPVGKAGRLRPRRLAEEAQLTPKGASWSCNQLTHSKIATMFTKIAFFKSFEKRFYVKLLHIAIKE